MHSTPNHQLQAHRFVLTDLSRWYNDMNYDSVFCALVRVPQPQHKKLVESTRMWHALCQSIDEFVFITEFEFESNTLPFTPLMRKVLVDGKSNTPMSQSHSVRGPSDPLLLAEPSQFLVAYYMSVGTTIHIISCLWSRMTRQTFRSSSFPLYQKSSHIKISQIPETHTHILNDVRRRRKLWKRNRLKRSEKNKQKNWNSRPTTDSSWVYCV